MIIGYARVSTLDQNLDLQNYDLTEFGCNKIYSEKKSSGKDRPILNEVLSFIREGDTLCVWKLDRLGRSVKELIKIINILSEKKVNFVCIKDKIDTSSAYGKFIFHIMASLAEFEKDLISERTKEGLRVARLKGHFAGRPKGLNKESKKKAKIAWNLAKNPEYSVNQIIEDVGISKATYYRYCEWASFREFEDKYDGKKISYEFWDSQKWIKKKAIVNDKLKQNYYYRYFRNIKCIN